MNRIAGVKNGLGRRSARVAVTVAATGLLFLTGQAAAQASAPQPAPHAAAAQELSARGLLDGLPQHAAQTAIEIVEEIVATPQTNDWGTPKP
ncbi:hypothetical protein H9Y04_40800 [Streptomyces sp. TRM66268-LWL]|uniref:Uncharacterized protein n=1 Tax=Streptomyces polyasparticus TaxID=2767826 RepID=A0ABR7SWC2_9ACTN|nr:hypothetical protein [Streptomyces polyasparticus]MBC9718887.1 hypothetical protein [Streptomyces polyasparticus]